MHIRKKLLHAKWLEGARATSTSASERSFGQSQKHAA